MMITMDLYNDNAEKIRYDTNKMPVMTNRAQLSHYPNYAATSHWHDDVEFTVLLTGTMDYNINGHVHTLEAGDGIFVNSRQIHYGFSPTKTDCEFICVLLHPILLCANEYIEQTLVSPVLSNDAFPYHLLSSDVSWQNALIQNIKDIYDTCHSAGKAAALSVQSRFYQIWELLFEHNTGPIKISSVTSHHLTALKDMISFMQHHYNEKITLDDICNAGSVCKSSCCALFQRYLHQTPVNYLIDYRLNKSIELLSSTDMSVTEISYALGFCSSSYYSETFRKNLGCSPGMYRKSLAK